MAVITPKTLVLRGVSVLRDGMTVETRLGRGYQGPEQPPAPISLRHLSPGNPGENEPDARHVLGADQRPDQAADRAGRPGCSAGVPSCRSRAAMAPRSPARRELLARGPNHPAAAHAGSIGVSAAASVDKARSGRFLTATTTPLLTASGLTKPRRVQGGKRPPADLPWFTWAGETSTTATRGKGG